MMLVMILMTVKIMVVIKVEKMMGMNMVLMNVVMKTMT